LTVSDDHGYVDTITKTIAILPDTIPVPPPIIDSNKVVTGSMPVSVTFPHKLNPDNVITVQLMNDNAAPGGRGVGPDIIDLVNFPSVNSRVDVNVILPKTLACGKNYRIRVMSSSPADSSAWSSAFEVVNPPAVPVIAQRGDSLACSAGYAYQWYKNGKPVAGVTTRAIRAKTNGTYQVEVFSEGQCSTMSAPVSMIITGVSEVGLTVSQLKVFPNPSNGAVYMQLEQLPAKPLPVVVYNRDGVIVRSLLMKDKLTVLDLSQQPKGIYYILLKGADKQKAVMVVIQ
jgi:hypothetical protein